MRRFDIVDLDYLEAAPRTWKEVEYANFGRCRFTFHTKRQATFNSQFFMHICIRVAREAYRQAGRVSPWDENYDRRPGFERSPREVHAPEGVVAGATVVRKDSPYGRSMTVSRVHLVAECFWDNTYGKEQQRGTFPVTDLQMPPPPRIEPEPEPEPIPLADAGDPNYDGKTPRVPGYVAPRKKGGGGVSAASRIAAAAERAAKAAETPDAAPPDPVEAGAYPTPNPTGRTKKRTHRKSLIEYLEERGEAGASGKEIETYMEQRWGLKGAYLNRVLTEATDDGAIKRVKLGHYAIRGKDDTSPSWRRKNRKAA